MSYIIHDVIKMNYIRMGYLPDYPYHLISDKEMCDAFLNDGDFSYFADNYPCVDSSLQDEYDELVNNLKWHLEKLKAFQSKSASTREYYMLPDWVYSYMLGSTLGVNSDKLEIHDMLVLMGMDNLDDVFTRQVARKCYHISKDWLKKLPSAQKEHRSPTMFGELHVLKSLRLEAVKFDKI